MRKVLVVDDSDIDRLQVERTLQRRAGWQISTATDGHLALQQFETGVPDIVVTDLQMPRMNGLELVTAIKDEFPATPVILMTATGSEEIAAEALRRGAAGYVPKRNIASDLVNTVERVLASVGQDRDHCRLMHHLTTDDADFDLPADLDLIQTLVAHLQCNLRCLPLGDETERLRVSIAVNEALLNAYYHGSLEIGTANNHQDRRGAVVERLHIEPYRDRRIHVRARISRTEAVYVIRDEGPGFDPGKYSNESSLGDVEGFAGRGIVLMRTIMDEVRYNDSGNEVTLLKRYHAPVAGQDLE